MTVILKKLLGEAGAGLDEAHGFDTLYDVLSALIAQLNDQADQFNQLLTDYNANSNIGADSTAAAITKGTSVE